MSKRTELQNYEDAVTHGRPTKRVRDVGSLAELGVVGAQILRPTSPYQPLKPVVLATVRPTTAIKPSMVVGWSVPAPKAPTVITTGSIHLATPTAAAAFAPASKPVFTVPVGGGGGSSSSTDDGSSVDTGSQYVSAPAYMTTAPDAEGGVTLLADSALDAGVARLAARGAVVPLDYPIFPPSNIAGLGDVGALAVIAPPTLVPLAIFVGASLACVGVAHWEKRKRRR